MREEAPEDVLHRPEAVDLHERVTLAVEVAGLQYAGDPSDHFPIEQDAAEDGFLGLDVMRRQPLRLLVEPEAFDSHGGLLFPTAAVLSLIAALAAIAIPNRGAVALRASRGEWRVQPPPQGRRVDGTDAAATFFGALPKNGRSLAPHAL